MGMNDINSRNGVYDVAVIKLEVGCLYGTSK